MIGVGNNPPIRTSWCKQLERQEGQSAVFTIPCMKPPAHESVLMSQHFPPVRSEAHVGVEGGVALVTARVATGAVGKLGGPVARGVGGALVVSAAAVGHVTQ